MIRTLLLSFQQSKLRGASLISISHSDVSPECFPWTVFPIADIAVSDSKSAYLAVCYPAGCLSEISPFELAGGFRMVISSHSSILDFDKLSSLHL